LQFPLLGSPVLLRVALPALAHRDHDGARRARIFAANLGARVGTADRAGHGCDRDHPHLTSYALVAFIAALALGHWLLRKSWSWPNPWKFAVLAAALALAWLLLAASSTFGYLSS